MGRRALVLFLVLGSGASWGGATPSVDAQRREILTMEPMGRIKGFFAKITGRIPAGRSIPSKRGLRVGSPTIDQLNKLRTLPDSGAVRTHARLNVEGKSLGVIVSGAPESVDRTQQTILATALKSGIATVAGDRDLVPRQHDARLTHRARIDLRDGAMGSLQELHQALRKGSVDGRAKVRSTTRLLGSYYRTANHDREVGKTGGYESQPYFDGKDTRFNLVYVEHPVYKKEKWHEFYVNLVGSPTELHKQVANMGAAADRAGMHWESKTNGKGPNTQASIYFSVIDGPKAPAAVDRVVKAVGSELLK